MNNPAGAVIDPAEGYGGETSPRPSFETLGRKGGNTTLERHGLEHYRRMAKRSVQRRRARKAADTELTSELRAFLKLVNN